MEHAREEHLLLDPRSPAEVNEQVLATMQKTSPRFWIAVMVLGAGTTLLFLYLGNAGRQRHRGHRA